MTKSNKQIEWKARINDWKASGLSKAKWCRENGLKEHQMHYWVKQIDETESTGFEPKKVHEKFLPIDVTNERIEPKGSVLIHIDRMSIEIQPGADTDLLSKVLHILKL